METARRQPDRRERDCRADDVKITAMTEELRHAAWLEAIVDHEIEIAEIELVQAKTLYSGWRWELERLPEATCGGATHPRRRDNS